MKRKNQRLGIAAAVLLVINLGFFFLRGSKVSSTRQPQLAISDTSLINQIKLTQGGQSNVLKRANGSWVVNDEFNTDPSYVRILLAVLRRVEVKRVLGREQLEQLVPRLEQEGVNVQIEGVDRAFKVIGNRTFTKTYFIEDDLKTGYEVEIPGYRDYLGGIFQLSKDQWRDRLIFKGNFHTIQEISILAGSERIFQLALEGRYFTIKGMSAFDTTALVNYLNGFAYVQANERISKGKFPRYDSLSQTVPSLQLLISDLGRVEPLDMKIFAPLPGERFQLVMIDDSELVVFGQSRLQTWLAENDQFALK